MRYTNPRLLYFTLLETQVRGHSRSLEIAKFDRLHTTSYWHSIVTMALDGPPRNIAITYGTVKN